MPKKPNGLRRRGNVWECRKVVPDDVRNIIGKKEIIRSLQTSDYQTALRKHRIVMFEVDNQIDAARRKLEQQQAAKAAQDGTPPIRALSTEEIQSIVLTWFHDLESGNAPSAEMAQGDPMSADAI